MKMYKSPWYREIMTFEMLNLLEGTVEVIFILSGFETIDSLTVQLPQYKTGGEKLLKAFIYLSILYCFS